MSMLEFYVVTLVPAVAVLTLIAILRLRASRNQEAEVILVWEPDKDTHPVAPSGDDSARWRKSYFG
jgi:hypothetical protein